MFTYCLFCETVKCRVVAHIAEQRMDCRAIAPVQVQHLLTRQGPVDVEHDLLPGYVFLYAEDKLDIAVIRRIEGVIRCLYDQDKKYELSGEDERFALMLLQKNGVIGKTKVFRVGQRIQICKGAFAGVEARILKVDHRRMRMQIELPFTRQSVKTWVEYELVEGQEETIEDAPLTGGKVG